MKISPTDQRIAFVHMESRGFLNTVRDYFFWVVPTKKMDMSKASLIKRAQKICYNNEIEPFSLDKWNELTVQQLRAIVVLGNSQMVEMINQHQKNTKGHCFAIDGLVSYLRANPSNAINPLNKRKITRGQRSAIYGAYHRLTGKSPASGYGMDPPPEPLPVVQRRKKDLRGLNINSQGDKFSRYYRQQQASFDR